jgi:hypothetical protein
MFLKILLEIDEIEKDHNVGYMNRGVSCSESQSWRKPLETKKERGKKSTICFSPLARIS